MFQPAAQSAQQPPGQHTGPTSAECQAAESKPVGPAGVQQALVTLDQVLAGQPHAQTLLLPTPCNIDPIHVPGEDLLAMIKVQQHILTHLRLKLPLPNGMFVLVPTAQQAAPSNGSGSSTSSSLTATAIPWRLCQKSAVEVAPGGEAADATVVLVGGDRVCAGAVREGLLAEVQDYQYLCCEVAALQHQGQLRQLWVFDVAHMAWRLKVAFKLDQALHTPCEQVLQYLELNPQQQPVPQNQPWQLLSPQQHTQLLQDAAKAWQHYMQCKLAGQQLQPVTQFVPWRAVSREVGEVCGTDTLQLPVPEAASPFVNSETAAGLPPTLAGDAAADAHACHGINAGSRAQAPGVDRRPLKRQGRYGPYQGGRPGSNTGRRPSSYEGGRPSSYQGGRPSSYAGGRLSGYKGGRQYMGGYPHSATGVRPSNYKAGRLTRDEGGRPISRKRGHSSSSKSRSVSPGLLQAWGPRHKGGHPSNIGGSIDGSRSARTSQTGWKRPDKKERQARYVAGLCFLCGDPDHKLGDCPHIDKKA